MLCLITGSLKLESEYIIIEKARVQSSRIFFLRNVTKELGLARRSDAMEIVSACTLFRIYILILTFVTTGENLKIEKK